MPLQPWLPFPALDEVPASFEELKDFAQYLFPESKTCVLRVEHVKDWVDPKTHETHDAVELYIYDRKQVTITLEPGTLCEFGAVMNYILVAQIAARRGEPPQYDGPIEPAVDALEDKLEQTLSAKMKCAVWKHLKPAEMNQRFFGHPDVCLFRVGFIDQSQHFNAGFAVVPMGASNTVIKSIARETEAGVLQQYRRCSPHYRAAANAANKMDPRLCMPVPRAARAGVEARRNALALGMLDKEK
jgi:hypothetical protein